MRKLLIVGFVAFMSYVAITAYETAVGEYAAAVSAARDLGFLADSRK
jgi:hypothetical protein